MKRSTLRTIFEIFVYLLFGMYLFLRPGASLSSNNQELLFLLGVAYLWIGILVFFAKIVFELDLFEPMFFVTALYFLIFIVKPTLDLKSGSMYAHGVYVAGGGKRATVWFLLSYSMFFLGYYMKLRRAPASPSTTDQNGGAMFSPGRAWNPVTLYAFWIVAFAACLTSMFSQGLSFRYIMSMGAEGAVTKTSSTPLLFLDNFAVTMISLWLIIVFKTKGRLLKALITALMVLYFIMRNARWLILVFALAPVVYYYLKRKKRPSFLLLAVISTLVLVVFAWMQFNRRFIAAGEAVRGFGETGRTLEVMLAPFESDLTTYKVFYAMVSRIPSVYPFMGGITFLYVFILFIPRAIWHAKPDNPVREMIEHSLNAKARASGSAVANIGEIYANFGVIGCVVLMYLFGVLASLMKKLADGSSDDNLLAYSVLYPLLFQWVARGNFSGNIFMTIFAMLPFLLRAASTRVRVGGIR